MHRHLYSAVFSGVAVTAVQDLLALTTVASSRIAICRVDIMQTSDVGDAASENLAYRFIRGASTVGSGGSAPTPQNIKGWGRAAVTTARANDTTQATGGSPVVVYSSGFNIAAGLLYAPRFGDEDGVDERITVAESSRFVVSLDTVPADSLTFSGTIVWEELGLTA